MYLIRSDNVDRGLANDATQKKPTDQWAETTKSSDDTVIFALNRQTHQNNVVPSYCYLPIPHRASCARIWRISVIR